MNISGQINRRRLRYTTSASLILVLLFGISAVYYGQPEYRPTSAIAGPGDVSPAVSAHSVSRATDACQPGFDDEDSSSASDNGPADAEEGESATEPAADDDEEQVPAARAENTASQSPLPAKTAVLPVAAKAATPAVSAVFKAARGRDDNGIVFAGQSDQIAKVKAQMTALLAQMGWTANQVLTRESPAGERIAYVLNSAPGDTNTFVLSQQPQLGIGPEMISYTSRLGQKKTLALVSQKEILAAMLQAGRAFLFSGPRCQVDALKEQLALRQNVVYWGLRADWVFPEDKIYRYNTGDYWQVMTGDDWMLKPGIRAAQAVADAFVGKFSYQIGCTSACRFIFTHGIVDFYRSVRPNPAAVARLEQVLDPSRPFVDIAPTVDHNRVVVKEGRLMERHTDVPWNHWVPGDWGWIKNPDDKSAEELGSEGCNIIYAGGGFFVNYYPERPPKTLEQAIKRVYGWRFGLEESELDLPADLMHHLFQDPRSGGMLRDVRDYPRQFGISAPAQPGA